jgi:pimeloyl-ACP methyl ester carboxylesterase
MTTVPTDPSRYPLTMDTVRSKDGTTIAYDRRGDGPPVVIVGGALSERGAAANLSEALAGRMTAIAFDRRGRGDSGDTQPYAVEREIEDIAALIDAVGGSSFVLGHSSGAVLSLLAAEAGLPIQRLALYEPPFIVDDSRPPLPDDYVRRIDELVAAGRGGDAVEYFMATGPRVPAAAIEGAKRSPAWAGMTAIAHTLSYDNRIMGDTMAGDAAPLSRWSRLATPTLVMGGGDSPPAMHNAAAALAAVLPNVTTRTLAGQTHGAAAEVMAPVLLDFFLG